MKKSLLGIVLAMLLACPVVLMAADITEPGDAVYGWPYDNNWPGAEAPANAIDNNWEEGVHTKYLHFEGASGPCGFWVTPSHNDIIVTGMNFMSANDARERNPVNFTLYGANGTIEAGGTFEAGDAYCNLVGDEWTEIVTADIPDFADPEWPFYTPITTPISFVNDTAYTHYFVKFNTMRGTGQNSMQIAEVELLERPAEGWAPSLGMPADALVLAPATSVTLTPTVVDADTAPEQMTYAWEMLSGPAALDFGGTEDELEATVTLTVSGEYELQLTVTDDTAHVATGTVIVRYWIPAEDNRLLAYWNLNEGVFTDGIADGTVIADTAPGGLKADDGVLHVRPEGSDPNWVDGWIPGDGANNNALDMISFDYIEVSADSNDLRDTKWQISISAWMKVTEWIGNPRILQKGLADNQFRLLAERGNMVLHLAGVGRLETVRPPAGLWHHVVGTYDGSVMKMFIDGIEYGQLEASGPIGQTEDPLFIGAKAGTVTVAGDYFYGALDDVRIYNYALSSSEISDLVTMGQNAAPAIVSITAPEEVVMVNQNYADIVSDVQDFNGDTINYLWTCEDTENVSFVDATAANPRVQFADGGTYTIVLTVDDGFFGLNGEITASVDIVVTNPGCAEVIADGKGMLADFNEDCVVDLLDFQEFANMWMVCNDPQQDGCINPYASTAFEE